MHEILTIQCGNAANYIGTHFWNFQDPVSRDQEEIDHNVLFSAGQARNGMESYTPRLLIYDRTRHYGSMRRINDLYADPEDPASVGRTTTTVDGTAHGGQTAQVVHKEPRITSHAFQDSLEQDEIPDGTVLGDSNVRYWSDYNMHFYRPNSYLPIDSSSLPARLQTHEDGLDLYRHRTQTESDILDTDVRPFMEECDLVQGINLLTDVTDGWGGFSLSLLMDLGAEFPKVSKFVSFCNAPRTRDEYRNAGSAVLGMHDEVDSLIPFKSACESWSTSASAALWMDSLTVPVRLKGASLRLSDLPSFLIPNHKIFGSGMLDFDINAVPGHADRQFRVERQRGDSEEVLRSELHNGSLVTTYRHACKVEYPASFPDSKRAKEGACQVSLRDSASGSSTYLKDIREMITGIRGAVGYNERKEQIEEIKELEGLYRSELFEEEGSSDEDGF